MKRILLLLSFITVCLTANAQFYQLRYDSVRVVSKFKLGSVSTGAVTDSILTKKANGGVYKVAQSNFATTANIYFSRTATTLSPITAGDKILVSVTGSDVALRGNSVSNVALYGNSTGSGAGVFGSSATGYGGQFLSSSATNAAIFGSNTSGGNIAQFSNGSLTAIINSDATITAPLLGYTKTLTGSGTGIATTISIAHGLTGITSASPVVASANTSAAAGYNYVDIDAANVNFYYTVAPIAGSGNLKYSVTIK